MLIDELKQKAWKLWSSELTNREFVNTVVELVASKVAKEILSDTIQNIKHKDRNQRVIVHNKCQEIINQCQQGE